MSRSHLRSLLLLLHDGLSNALPIGDFADAKKFGGRRLLDTSLPTAASTTPGDTEWSRFVPHLSAYGPGRSRLYIKNQAFMGAVDSSIPTSYARWRTSVENMARSITSLQYLDLTSSASRTT